MNRLTLPSTPEKEWAFAHATQKDTGYITHCYHRYPAKFIPQLANKIIQQFSKEGDVVFDPFAGCGTSMIEAQVLGRKSLGIDVNPIACMITEAKITPIHPDTLQCRYDALRKSFKTYTSSHVEKNSRINYWFGEENISRLDFMLNAIKEIDSRKERVFFLCAFSNILKNCSIWAQKSNKPLRDFKKIPADPFTQFHKQFNKMYKGILDFYYLLKESGRLNLIGKVYCDDARTTKKINSESINLIVTSPPYVTSYEYADLHQLSLLWLEHTDNLQQFKKQFVGSLIAREDITSEDPAYTIINALNKKSPSMAKSVASYFYSMNCIFSNMYIMLKKGGKAVIVIGDTALKGVKISNAAVFLKYLQANSLNLVKIIKREIPSKNIPSTRDPNTGRFTSVSNNNKVFAYPTEYIIIAEK